ncbi:MAG TPA: hypothetical protein VHC45_06790 [Gaiellaceae bacterium]|nr:hypothetical protein [Gaiellaceae bacterium]HVV58054.1 hypothetical protein [Gaiellaceae bacterium]
MRSGPHDRVEDVNFKRWTYDQIAAQPDFSLDLWADVTDESQDSAVALPEPEVRVEEILMSVNSGLAQFAAVAAELGVELETQPALDAY